jgi:hypothetical protein
MDASVLLFQKKAGFELWNPAGISIRYFTAG